MGAKDSKPCCISYEEALRRVTDAEQKRIRDAFNRASNLNGIITRQAFIKEVLGEFVPIKLAEHIFQACGGTSKGINFKDLLCGLVLLTRGRKEEKIRFVFSLCANEAGTHVVKDDMVRLVQACDDGFVSEAVAECFTESDKVTYDEFREWLCHYEDSTSLTRWLLSEPSTVTLSNDVETPTFYQTLAGVTHLEERDIIDLEKRYWLLKTQSRTGKFDLGTLIPLVSPPVPLPLCKGVFNAFDENQDGHIDFKEMACGISACCRGPLAERQKFCFKVFDQDCDGMLSQKEVYHMIESLMYVRQENKSPGDEIYVSRKEVEEVVHEILEKYDTNKDGTITLDEYLVWTVGQTLTLDFLNLLFQVCHLVLGLRPTREEEGEIIRCWLDREERRGVQVGQFWYLISMDWWRSWNEYVDYQTDYSSQPVSSLKRSNRLQRKIDSSVARSSLDDGNSNVVLSSIISYGEDVVATLHSEVANSNSSVCGNGCSGFSGSTDCSTQQSQGIPKKASNVQTLEPPKALVTPGHSPVAPRKSGNGLPQKPPSIDNSSLIIPNTLKAMVLTGEGGKLKRNTVLTRGRDFEIVPEAVWRALSQWYGGSPALPRQVILPHGSDLPEFELYPITLKLFRHQTSNIRQPANSWSGVVGSVASAYGGSTTGYALQSVTPPKKYLACIASFSRMATLKQVFDFLCIRLRLRPEDTRLWLYKDDTNLSPLEEEDMTLEQLGIEDYEQILIEVRNKDQTWPEEMSSLLYARADQKNQGPTERGATGLNNLGNTCFMNAALQCVSNTRGLTLYFINNKHLYELNRVNPLGMKGHIAKRYGDLVHELWSGTSRTIAPLKLRWTIGKYAPRFNGFQQHDSQELLAFLMDGLHEDLNRVHEKPYVELKDSDGRPDEEVAQEAWENHILRNRSIIVDLFHGQLQSTVTCMVCGHASVHFDPFNYLSLPLPMESCVHIEVVVFRLDGSVPIKYGLRLNHDDRYLNLKQQLGELCHLTPQQLLVAEVAGSVIKTLPCDDHKIRSSITGPLFAYELPLNQENCCKDELRPYIQREQHSLNQIQRMPLSAISCRKQHSSNTVNEDAQRNTLCNNVSSASLNSNPSDGEQQVDKPVFKVGDANGDSWTSSASSQGNEPPSLSSLNSCSHGSGHWNLGPPNVVVSISSGPPSMTSSLISNTSTVDLTETGNRNIVIVYHRKMIRQDVYFMSSQKTRPTVFGLPLILPCNAMTTHQDLYQMVWTQVARLLSPLPPTETAAPNHAQDCDDSLGYEYPFTLKAIQKDGLMCAWCPWYRFCRGCRIDCCNADFNFSSPYIAIDWDATALHLRYQSPQERVFLDHESVEKAQRQQTDPISLHDCLEAFTREEQLGEEEKYYCSKCKKHQLASKKLQIWRLPPVLIVHLKRFQLLNGRWVKSHKIVKFPFKNFDPSEYLAAVPHKVVRHSETCGKMSLAEQFRSGLITNQKRSLSGDTIIPPLPPQERLSPEAVTIQPKSNSYNCNNHHSVNMKNSNEYKSVNASPGHLVLENGIDIEDNANQETNCSHYSEERVYNVQNGIMDGQIITSHKQIMASDQKNGEALCNNRSAGCGKGGKCQILQDFHQHKLQESYHPFQLKYNLYALVCHSGILGGGHYVSYACNPNNRWYCYNDSSCKEVQLDQIDTDSAYMLFYEREGIDYESYLPNVEGKIPDMREIDDEFESDFRKMCCLQ